jgi:hypothetical protein
MESAHVARHPGVPKACLHRASGQAVVRLGGKDFYLGKWKSVEAEAAYHRKIAEWIAAGPYMAGVDPEQKKSLLVSELVDVYHAFAVQYYQRSSEADSMKPTLRRLAALYGDAPVAEFGPLKLKAFRQALTHVTVRKTSVPLSRTSINQDIGLVRRMFRWAA